MSINDNIDTNNPWKTINSEIVYETPWLKLKKDNVKTPYGKDSAYTYISHQGSVAGVIINPQNEIYLVGQYRYPVQEFSWEIVKGGIEKGEEPLEAIKREISEETGIVASDYKLLAKDLHIENSSSNERGNVFLVSGTIEMGEQSLDPTEKIITKKVPFQEALNMVYEGKIKDTYSIVGILLANKVINNS